jgi:membrane-associated protease RseP (regulator of RpoE activity)
MLKTLTLVVAGLVAGFAVAFWVLPGAPTAASDLSTGSAVSVAAVNGGAASTAEVAALEDALATEVERRVALEARIGELAAKVEELGAAAQGPRGRPDDVQRDPQRPGGANIVPRDRQTRDFAEAAQVAERRSVERLIAGGFAPDRAEWINRRVQELRMQQMQAQYDATREGRAVDPALAMGSDRTLRNELGDAEYERYRAALNQPTNVDVFQVLASSPAERAGLKPGDQIVAYNGARVFDVQELNALTFQGNTGESVVIEIRRDGQALQLVVPRGPLGITGGFGGPAQRIGR